MDCPLAALEDAARRRWSLSACRGKDTPEGTESFPIRRDLREAQDLEPDRVREHSSGSARRPTRRRPRSFSSFGRRRLHRRLALLNRHSARPRPRPPHRQRFMRQDDKRDHRRAGTALRLHQLHRRDARGTSGRSPARRPEAQRKAVGETSSRKERGRRRLKLAEGRCSSAGTLYPTSSSLGDENAHTIKPTITRRGIQG
jgi:hypothetical protein